VTGSYAVVWSGDDGVASGRLEPCADGFELYGRHRRSSIPFGDLVGASIARRHADRLRGLPVLVLLTRSGVRVRIASLEGAGVLHELAQHVERAGLPVTS
jgi:hypothetical protein